MTTPNGQEQLAYQGIQEEEDFSTRHELDQILQADPDYAFDHPLKDKVEMDMALDTAIGLDKSTLSIPDAIGTGLKSGLDFAFKK